MTCNTELRYRRDDARDLWCKTHQTWVYQDVGSELLNEEHEAQR